MPFPPQKPRPFDRESVESLTSGVVGCYGLFRRDRRVFIGGGDIRQRLLGHLAGDRPGILRHRPTHWVAIETADYETLARDLVLACAPLCNPDAARLGGAGQKVQGTGRSGSAGSAGSGA